MRLAAAGQRAVAGTLRRWRRFRFRGTNNAPYLSGDFFRSCCELHLEDATDRRAFAARVPAARTIFVKTDHADEFFERFAPRALACRVLFTGNSDREIQRMPSTLPPRLGRWFAQNSFVSHPLVRPLPIGLENQTLGENGVRALYRRCTPDEIAGKSMLVLAAFSRGHGDEREQLLQAARTLPTIDVVEHRISPAEFQQRLRRHRFVLAPRGNGIDTHRFWEALYADAVPVILRSAWSDAFEAEGIPFLALNAWDDVLGWSSADWQRCSARFPLRPSALPWLWTPFWMERVNALLQIGPGRS